MRTALVWGGANVLFVQTGAFVVFVLLARTLPPEVFGVFAFALVFIDFFAAQGKAALCDAVIIRQDFSRRALSNALWVGYLAVIPFVAISAPVAAPLADIMQMPQLANVLPALAATLLLVPPIAVMEAVLFARLQMRTMALRTMAMVVVGGGAGVAVAFGPSPEWALVAQRVAQYAAAIVLLWAVTRLEPAKPDVPALWPLLRHAGALWRNQALVMLPHRAVEALVGARLGAGALGTFRVVGRFIELVQQPLIGPLQTVLTPVLSRHRGEIAPLRQAVERLWRVAAGLTLPAFVGLALVAEEVISVFLGDKYVSSWPILALLAVTGVFSPILGYRNQILASIRKNGLVTVFSGFELVLTVAIVWVALPFGLVTVIAALAVSTCVIAMYSLVALLRVLQAPVRAFAAAVGPAALSTAAMAAAVLAARPFLDGAPDLVRLLALVATGAAAYGAWLLAAHRAWARDTLRLLRAAG